MKKLFLVFVLLLLSAPCFAVFCINCGKNLPDHAKFCSACGKPIASSSAEQENGEADPIFIASDSMLIRICFTTLETEKYDRISKMFRLTISPVVKIAGKEFEATKKDSVSSVFDYVVPQNIAGKELQVLFSADRRKWTVFNYGQWSNKQIELKKKLSEKASGDLFFVRAFYVNGISGDTVSFHINTPDQIEKMIDESERGRRVASAIKNFYAEQAAASERFAREINEQERQRQLNNINRNLSEINRKMGY